MSGKPNCKKCRKPKSQCNCGRPLVIDSNVLQKLEDAFAFCYNDAEACFYAGIGQATLYNYQKAHPEFVERKQALRLSPNLAAKKELVANIKGNLPQARWWAQNKMNDEFGEKTTIKHEGGVDSEEVTKGIDKAVRAFNETMRGVLTSKKKVKKDENTNRTSTNMG